MTVERSSAQPDSVSTVISKEEASTHVLLLDGESSVEPDAWTARTTSTR